jgi:hypothetical protein
LGVWHSFHHVSLVGHGIDAAALGDWASFNKLKIGVKKCDDMENPELPTRRREIRWTGYLVEPRCLRVEPATNSATRKIQ